MFVGLFYAVVLTLAHASDWEVLGVTDGVTVSRKTTPGSDLFAFRGETVTDIPASKLSSVILNDPIGPEWVDLMYLSSQLTRYDETTKLIHQGYDLPWPIQDRDYVMKQTASYDQQAKLFTLTFQSVEDPLMPVQECCVRAVAYRTFWSLEVLPSGKTKVIVEVNTDPKGSLPDWLVNLIQEDWPHTTINALINRASKDDIILDPYNKSWQ
jgi:hypothetical protein